MSTTTRLGARTIRTTIAVVFLALGVSALLLNLPAEDAKPSLVAPPQLFPASELASTSRSVQAAARTGTLLAARWLRTHPVRNDAAFTTFAKRSVPRPKPQATEADQIAIMHRLDRNRTPARVAAVNWLLLHGKKDVWKLFAKQYGQLYGKRRGTTAKRALKVAFALAGPLNTSIKLLYRIRHPWQLDRSLRPLVPDHKSFSFPANHANFSFAAATVLSGLEPARAHEFHYLADEVSYSRLVADAHFTDDLVGGAFEGGMVGEYELHLVRTHQV